MLITESWCTHIYTVSLYAASPTSELAPTSVKPWNVIALLVNLRSAFTVLSFAIAEAASCKVRAGSTGAWLPPHAVTSITARTKTVVPLIAPNSTPPALFRVPGAHDQADRAIVKEVIPGPVHEHQDP